MIRVPGDVAYVWHAGVHAGRVATSIEEAGFRVRAQIIWAKQHFAMGRGDYHWQHEPAYYAVRPGRPSRWRGDRTQSIERFVRASAFGWPSSGIAAVTVVSVALLVVAFLAAAVPARWTMRIDHPSCTPSCWAKAAWPHPSLWRRGTPPARPISVKTPLGEQGRG